ncbi:MAG: hypothetical protein M1815_004340 [Lichina confinis]|nr:MAG: hypothetical protein M1815_004340 [Lichina confinis]
MPSLMDLPDELLLIILDSLDADDDEGSSVLDFHDADDDEGSIDVVKSVLRTCRRLRDLGEIKIYTLVSFFWFECPKCGSPDMRSFLDDILKKPKRMEYCKNLAFLGYHSPAPVWVFPPNNKMVEGLKQLVENGEYSHSERGSWRQPISEWLPCTAAALIISQATNLEVLTLDQELTDTDFLLEIFRNSIWPRSPRNLPFNCLRKVELYSSVWTYPTPAARYNPRKQPYTSVMEDYLRVAPSGAREAMIGLTTLVLSLPAIQMLYSALAPPPNMSQKLFPVDRPRACTLHKLTLRPTTLREGHLDELLAVTPNLKALRLSVIFDKSNVEGGWSRTIDCGLLHEALSRVSATIELINLDIIDGGYDGNLSINTRFGSLRDFKKLTHLSIPHAILFGPSPRPPGFLLGRLPQTMRHFHFESWSFRDRTKMVQSTDRDVYDQVKLYFDRREEWAPMLGSFDLRFNSVAETERSSWSWPDRWVSGQQPGFPTFDDEGKFIRRHNPSTSTGTVAQTPTDTP